MVWRCQCQDIAYKIVTEPTHGMCITEPDNGRPAVEQDLLLSGQRKCIPFDPLPQTIDPGCKPGYPPTICRKILLGNKQPLHQGSRSRHIGLGNGIDGEDPFAGTAV